MMPTQLPAQTARPAGAVCVRGRIAGQLQVQDRVAVLNVQTSRRHIAHDLQRSVQLSTVRRCQPALKLVSWQAELRRPSDQPCSTHCTAAGYAASIASWSFWNLRKDTHTFPVRAL
jgi:hypothetical protein